MEKNFAKDIDYKIILSNFNEKLAPQVCGADALSNGVIFHQVVENPNLYKSMSQEGISSKEVLLQVEENPNLGGRPKEKILIKYYKNLFSKMGVKI